MESLRKPYPLTAQSTKLAEVGQIAHFPSDKEVREVEYHDVVSGDDVGIRVQNELPPRLEEIFLVVKGIHVAPVDCGA